MRRHLSDPFHPRVLRLYLRVQAFGNRLLDEDLFALGEQGYEPLFLGDGPVDLSGFSSRKWAMAVCSSLLGIGNREQESSG